MLEESTAAAGGGVARRGAAGRTGAAEAAAAEAAGQAWDSADESRCCSSLIADSTLGAIALAQRRRLCRILPPLCHVQRAQRSRARRACSVPRCRPRRTVSTQADSNLGLAKRSAPSSPAPRCALLAWHSPLLNDSSTVRALTREEGGVPPWRRMCHVARRCGAKWSGSS